ncbi:MAG TPA: endolytic transglycosylase MltG [Candidatus Limnocylindrales bacterium]|jgi:UPF0755 protein
MTIRRGGRAREVRSQAHPIEPEVREPTRHPWSEVEPPPPPVPAVRDLRPERRSNGHHGPLRFLAFAVILGGLVLVLVVGLGLTILRPLAREAIVGWAWDNQGSLKIGLVADLVKEDLGPALTDRASDDPAEVQFEVQAGDTPETLAPRLAEAGVIASERAFLYLAIQEQLAPELKEGTFLLRRDMTPEEVVRGLVENKVTVRVLDLTFREGLRLEQMTALLQTKSTAVDPAAFYDLVKHPTARLLRDYAWLQLPDGASLEGYLYPATYRLVIDPGGTDTKVTTADSLVRSMLDTFREQVGAQRMKVPAARGLDFYETLTLASIVEREAVVDEERPLIAGVYQNRIERKPAVPHGLLQADPTVLYAYDTTRLGGYNEDWQRYVFWDPRTIPQGSYKDLPLPAELAGYNTYAVRGLPPGPICTPSVDSIDAALEPDVTEGYAFFVAIPEGDGRHDFSKTIREHTRKLEEYGYR